MVITNSLLLDSLTLAPLPFSMENIVLKLRLLGSLLCYNGFICYGTSRRGNLVWLDVMIEMQPVSMWHQKQCSLNKIKLFIGKFNN